MSLMSSKIQKGRIQKRKVDLQAVVIAHLVPALIASKNSTKLQKCLFL